MNTFTYQHKGEFFGGFDSKEIFSLSILNKSPMMNFSISDTRISSLSMIFICSCIFFVKPLASSTTGFWYGYFLLMSVSLWKMKNHISIRGKIKQEVYERCTSAASCGRSSFYVLYESHICPLSFSVWQPDMLPGAAEWQTKMLRGVVGGQLDPKTH